MRNFTFIRTSGHLSKDGLKVSQNKKFFGEKFQSNRLNLRNFWFATVGPLLGHFSYLFIINLKHFKHSKINPKTKNTAVWRLLPNKTYSHIQACGRICCRNGLKFSHLKKDGTPSWKTCVINEWTVGKNNYSVYLHVLSCLIFIWYRRIIEKISERLITPYFSNNLSN